MRNVVNNLTKALLLTTCFLNTGAFAQTDHNSGGGLGGGGTNPDPCPGGVTSRPDGTGVICHQN